MKRSNISISEMNILTLRLLDISNGLISSKICDFVLSNEIVGRHLKGRPDYKRRQIISIIIVVNIIALLFKGFASIRVYLWGVFGYRAIETFVFKL